MSEDSSHSAESVESSVEDDQNEESAEPKPWESPREEPVAGIVQPRIIAPAGKPTRHTNQLDYLLNTILKDAMKHKHSWPFHSPVDAVKLAIPEYHKVIHKPMDLRTIEKRLKNVYYYSASEAIEDIMRMFNNCYTFNPSHYGVYAMAKGLEEFFLRRLTELPEDEVEIQPPSTKRGPKARGGAKNVGNRGTPTSSKRKTVADDDALTAEDQHVIDHFHRATRTVSRESSVVSIQQKDADSSIDAHDDTEASASTSLQDSAPKQIANKGVKRKADTTTIDDEPGGKMAARRESTRPIKKRDLFIDYAQLQPRQKGKIPESLKFCQKIVQELLSKKYKSFAWPFYEPVDVEALNLTDYYDIIAIPMDLGTVKKKLENRQYLNAQEFADDIRLICSNCSTYNPAGTDIHNHGLELLRVFEKKFKDLPQDHDEHEGVGGGAGSLTVQTDMNEDDKINTYLNLVKAEQKKCAEKLEHLRSFGEVLYEIAMQRKDAKLQGKAEPILLPQHYQQIEKLGLVPRIGFTTPKNELISPAVSVRSSGRAPVPKVFQDDIKLDTPRASSSANAASAQTASSVLTAAAAAAAASSKKANKTSGLGNLDLAAAQASSAVYAAALAAAANSANVNAAAAIQAVTAAAAAGLLNQSSSSSQASADAVAAAAAAAVATEPRPYSGRGRRPGSKNKPKQPPKKEYEFDSDDDSVTVEYTYDEKLELSKRVSQFPMAKISEVLKIIETRESRIDPNFRLNKDEMEIDFDMLDTLTLHELDAYVTSVEAKERKTKKLMPIKDPEEAEKMRNEIQRQLEVISGNTGATLKTSSIPSTSSGPAGRSKARDSSSDSSDSSSSSSSESSSDSDSESAGPRLDELSGRKRIGELQANGFSRIPPVSKTAPAPAAAAPAPAAPPAAPPAAAAPPAHVPPQKRFDEEGISMRAEDILARSHVHAGAKPLLANEKTVTGGIGVTILDSLLPPTPAKNNGGDYQSRRAQEEEERRKKKEEEDEAENARIRRCQEESRRKRMLEDGVAITDQMEMMANFEASF